MKQLNELSTFMELVQNDPRIGPLHISLYTVLFNLWILEGAVGPVTFTAKELMPKAKILGLTAYHRCIKQLHAYGYIVYEPSNDSRIKSRAYMDQL